MPLLSTAAMDADLDACYGLTRKTGLPSAHGLALFVGDPMVDGIELDPTDNPGYARAVVTAAMWLAASDGFKSTQPVLFAAPTGPWLDEPTHWALFDGSTGWDCAPLVEPLAITAAGGSDLKVTVTVFYDDAVLAPV